ncbi:hypothetical protein [Corynebacterium diphtheriae]|nr:hypothetical protein [Corynebacterium diphtheriae]
MVGFSPKRYTYDAYLLGKQKEKSEAAVNENQTNSSSTVRVQGWGEA